jgi:mono/diheme cytochrome c family protein
MKLNRVKLFAITLFVLPILALAFFKVNPVRAISKIQDDEVKAAYKKDCALCHKPNAEKFFDTTKTDEEMTEIILKGKKAEKPPHMPGFEAKGMTCDKAKLLVEYMRNLRTPPSP